MSACYTIEADVMFLEENSSEEMWCGAIKTAIKTHDKELFSTLNTENTDPIYWFCALTSDLESVYLPTLVADFNASYGWWDVMCEAFIEAIKYCDSNSCIRMRGDEDYSEEFVITQSGYGWERLYEEDDYNDNERDY